MSKRVVVACFGDAQSTETIQRLAATAEVIAVAFDFGGAVSLGAMRDAALAAGARRCHALDVREEFARDCLWPAVRARAFADPTAAVTALAPEFAARKLDDIARLEDATAIAPQAVVLVARSLTRPPAPPLQLEIGMEDGVPASVNGVPMTLSELMESLETITGEHALSVLEREMARSREPQPA